MRRRLLTAFMMSAMLSVALPVAARAMPPGPPVRQVSFTGTTYYLGASEQVDLDGNVHVALSLHGSSDTAWELDWQTNLDQTTGIGETTGNRYVATGADHGSIQFPPGPPARVELQPTFQMFPPGPPVHPPSPIRLFVDISFDQGGDVTAIDVHVEPGTTFGTTD